MTSSPSAPMAFRSMLSAEFATASSLAYSMSRSIASSPASKDLSATVTCFTHGP